MEAGYQHGEIGELFIFKLYEGIMFWGFRNRCHYFLRSSSIIFLNRIKEYPVYIEIKCMSHGIKNPNRRSINHRIGRFCLLLEIYFCCSTRCAFSRTMTGHDRHHSHLSIISLIIAHPSYSTPRNWSCWERWLSRSWQCFLGISI